MCAPISHVSMIAVFSCLEVTVGVELDASPLVQVGVDEPA